MNNRDLAQQAQLQLQAELAERQRLTPSGDPQLDSHRLVIRALRQAPALQLPPDFAARIAAKVAAGEQSSSLEDWLLTLLMLMLAVTGLIYVQPVLANVISHFHVGLPTLPWRLLVVAAGSMATVGLLDRAATGWRRGAQGR